LAILALSNFIFGDIPMKNDLIIEQALKVLEERMVYTTDAFKNPTTTMNYLKLRLATKEREEFHVLFLDSQNCLIEAQCMFQGTIDAASIWPREVAREALKLNASAMILGHNHPSGHNKASQADINITKRLVECMKLFDIRILDHIIVAKTECVSMAEAGLM
jgi:DNA repair protein RadC